MLKQRRAAAEIVAEALFAAEKAIDDAIAQTAALAGLMPVSRQDANLSAVVGQDALVRFHRLLGGWPIALILVHMVLTIIGYADRYNHTWYGETYVPPQSMMPSQQLAGTP